MEQDKPSGLKINNSRSRFSARKDSIDLEQRVKQLGEKMEGRKKKAYELGMKFMSYLKDRTVTQNKNQLAQSVEKETIANLMQFAVETNNDENEMEGMGSVAVSTLLFKAVFYLRDILNEMDYKIAKQEEKIKALNLQIEKLSSDRSADDESK